MSSIAILTKPGERIEDALVIPGSLNDPSSFVCGPASHGCRGFYLEPNLIHQPSGPAITNPIFNSHMQPVLQSGPATEKIIVESIEQFGSDTMLAMTKLAESIQAHAETGLKSMFATANGHFAGSAGAVQVNVSNVIKKIDLVNTELHKYVNAHNHFKHAAKASLREAYSAMQKEFNLIAEQTVRFYRTGRESALLSMKRGIEIAERYKSRVLPLNTLPEVSRMSKFLAGARYVAGVGLIFDLGLRANKVSNAFFGQMGNFEKGVKTAFEEVLGFSASYLLAGAALVGSTAFFCMFMGPWGLVPAILLSGTLGVATDMGGKALGGVLYNSLLETDFFK